MPPGGRRARGSDFPTTSARTWPGARRRPPPSFALVGHDFAVPSRGDDVDRADPGKTLLAQTLARLLNVPMPADLPRVDFFHGVRVTCTLNRRLRGR